MRRHAQADIADEVVQNLSNKNEKLMEESRREHDLRVQQEADAKVALAEAKAEANANTAVAKAALAEVKAEVKANTAVAKAKTQVAIVKAQSQAAVAEANNRAGLVDAELRGIAQGESVGYQRAMNETELYNIGFKDGQTRRRGALLETSQSTMPLPTRKQIEAKPASVGSDRQSSKYSGRLSRSTDDRENQRTRRMAESNLHSTTSPGDASTTSSRRPSVTPSTQTSNKDCSQTSTKVSTHNSKKGSSQAPVKDTRDATTKVSYETSAKDSGYGSSKYSTASYTRSKDIGSGSVDLSSSRDTSKDSETAQPTYKGYA